MDNDAPLPTLTLGEFRLLEGGKLNEVGVKQAIRLQKRGIVCIKVDVANRGLLYELTEIGNEALRAARKSCKPLAPKPQVHRAPRKRRDLDHAYDQRLTHKVPKQSDMVACPYPGCDWYDERRYLDSHQKEVHRRQERLI